MYVFSCWCNSYVSENVEHLCHKFLVLKRWVKGGQSPASMDRKRSYDWLTANERMWPVRWADVRGEERLTSLRTSAKEATAVCSCQPESQWRNVLFWSISVIKSGMFKEAPRRGTNFHLRDISSKLIRYFSKLPVIPTTNPPQVITLTLIN